MDYLPSNSRIGVYLISQVKRVSGGWDEVRDLWLAYLTVRWSERKAVEFSRWSDRRLRIAVAQQWCRDLKINPGPIDGIMGPKTRAALAVMESRATGTPMLARSDDRMGDVGPDFLPWLARAEALLGTQEIRGAKHSPVIMGWAKAQKIWYPNDEVPWCGLFVSHCMAHAGNWEQPDNPLGARKWLEFGQDVTPQLGAILVFWRGSRNGWKGHVNFYVGEDETAYHGIGGNQSNAVNVKRISKKRLLGARWPLGVEVEGIVRHLDARGRLSTNEA